jgi:hypothetical protein
MIATSWNAAPLAPTPACFRPIRSGFGGDDLEVAAAITSDARGHVLVVGEFHGSFELGDEPLTSGGDGDAFVAILDASGTPLGACGYGRSRTQRFTAIQPTSDGFVVAGAFEKTIDLGGGSRLTAAGGTDVVLAKLGPLPAIYSR